MHASTRRVHAAAEEPQSRSDGAGLRSDDWRNSLPLRVSAVLVARCSPGSSCSCSGPRWRAGPAAAIAPPRRRPAATPAGPPSTSQAIVNAHLFGDRRRCQATLDPIARAPATQMTPGAGRDDRRRPTRSRASPSSARARPTAKVYAVGKTDHGRRAAAFGLPGPGDPRPGRQARGAAAAEAVPGRRRPAAATHGRRRCATRAPCWAISMRTAGQPRTRRRSPRSCGRSRCSRMASSAATASIPAATAQQFAKLGLHAGRPGHRHQRHPARRPGARHGNLADA